MNLREYQLEAQRLYGKNPIGPALGSLLIEASLAGYPTEGSYYDSYKQLMSYRDPIDLQSFAEAVRNFYPQIEWTFDSCSASGYIAHSRQITIELDESLPNAVGVELCLPELPVIDFRVASVAEVRAKVAALVNHLSRLNG